MLDYLLRPFNNFVICIDNDLKGNNNKIFYLNVTLKYINFFFIILI